MPSQPPPSSATHSPEALLVGFGNALRAAGLPVTTDRTRSFVAAIAHLDLGRRSDVYWAGRATFCTRAADLPGYDRVFTAWFERGQSRTAQPHPEQSGHQAAVGPGDIEDGATSLVSTLASSAEQLRHRDVAELSAAERAWLNQAIQALPLPRPLRRTRRTEPYHHGRVDRVRTLRAELRRAGEPGPLHHARVRRRPRRLVLLIDVSGSMRPYADTLLRLAHRVARGTEAEVFTLGTRLTRITAALTHPDVDTALLRAGETIPDWSGGTRLADTLGAFISRWGRRGLARGAVVLIASDGWERGDPHLLGEQLSRLARLAYRVVWSNPHAGRAGYQPVQGGIVAALPHLDALVAGHSLAAFEQVLLELSAGRGGAAQKVREIDA
ncbi:vWA domain-containing protein [Ruania albidiflava]|uniref:vWA domain-containing protein n=1 Tax=Ruania albidiflava TaxID=366586 RepID=UPI0003B3ECFB|nr:VWA domain-containing protein [Ruania albidiflava]